MPVGDATCQASDRYSPGFLASILLHVPLGIAYLAAIREWGPIERADWIRGVALGVVFAASGVGAPNLILRDKTSPYAFSHKQMGRYEA